MKFFDKVKRQLPWFLRREKECAHVTLIQNVHLEAHGCEACLQTGDTWVHLRVCLICGHMGCCDMSKNKHATKHFRESRHPLIQSAEEGENWIWCYEDEVMLPGSLLE